MRFLTLCFLFVVFAQAHAGSYLDLQPGTWIEVGTNMIVDLDPEDIPELNPNFCDANNDGKSDSGCEAPYHASGGVISTIDAWSGGAFATGYGSLGGLIVWGGGHAAYYGNEVYIFNIAANKWERLSDPFFNPNDSQLGPSYCNQDTGEFPDGTPCTAHTYDMVDYDPVSNSFILIGHYALHEKPGGGSPRVHLFDLDTRQWRAGADHPVFSWMRGSTAYDSGRKVFWDVPLSSGPIGKYDPATAQWQTFTSDRPQFGDEITAFDTQRDLIVTLDHRGANPAFVVRAASNPSVSYDANIVGPDEILHSSKSDNTRPGFEYDEHNHVFVGWRGGNAVYILIPPDGDPRTDTWIIKKELLGGVTPSVPTTNGVFSRLRFVPALGAFIVVNQADEQVYMFQLGACAECPVVDTVAPDEPGALQVIE